MPRDYVCTKCGAYWSASTVHARGGVKAMEKAHQSYHDSSHKVRVNRETKSYHEANRPGTRKRRTSFGG